jgi:trehalose 2-sulfotransferase
VAALLVTDVRLAVSRAVSMLAAKARRVSRWVADPRAVLGRARRTSLTVSSVDTDWPPCDIERTVVIASEVRTGSTMLSELLASTRVCGVPAEYISPMWFNHWESKYGFPRMAQRDVIIAWWRRLRLRRFWDRTWNRSNPELQRYLDDVMRRRTTPNGVFAVNVHWHQWVEFEVLGFDESALRGEVTWVHLWREDVVAQAVSALRALQTDVWRSDEADCDRRQESAFYDEPELDRLVRKAIDGRDGWSEFFAARGIEPVEVTYERLVADRDGALAAIFHAARVDAGDRGAIPAASAPLERQADSLNSQWIARYRADHPLV